MHRANRSRPPRFRFVLPGRSVVWAVALLAGVGAPGRLPAQLAPAPLPGSGLRPGAAAAPGAPVSSLPSPPPAVSPVAPAAPTAPGSPALPAGGVSAPAGYLLAPDDQVAVEVFGEEDLRASGRLSAEGNLSLPLIGLVRLGGLTTAQASARVTELLKRDYLVNPRVSVSLLAYAQRRFTVLGQVNKPGSYDMPQDSAARGGIDLLEAIAVAGGYTRLAAPGRISVVRRGSAGGGGGSEAASDPEVIRVDAKRLAQGRGRGVFLVRPGDTITVAESIF